VDYASGVSMAGWLGRAVFLADAVESAEVNQDVGQGVLIGHGLAIAQPGALDAEFDGLGVDALGSGALLVDVLVDIAFTTSW